MVLGKAVISVQFKVKGFLTRPATVNCQSASLGIALLAGGIELYARLVKINSIAIVVIAAKILFNFNANFSL